MKMTVPAVSRGCGRDYLTQIVVASCIVLATVISLVPLVDSVDVLVGENATLSSDGIFETPPLPVQNFTDSATQPNVVLPNENMPNAVNGDYDNNRSIEMYDVNVNSIAISPYEEQDYSNESDWMEPRRKLCGYPVFVNAQNCNSNSSISSCMNYGKAIAFGMVILIMGVSIIAVNVLIPVLVFVNKSLRTQHYYIKASLAVVDSIVGFLLTFSVLPNMAWVAGISKEALVDYPAKDINSPHAVTVGALLTVSTTASLLHLTYLTAERFIAIKWPFRHMRRKTKSVIIAIVCLWAISLIVSFVPAAFPDHFAYQFQPTILIHMMTMQQVNGTMSEWRGVLYGTTTIILPYIVMTALCVMTTVETHRKIQKSRKSLQGELKSNPSMALAKRKKQKIKKVDPEISVFITVGMMITAFTLTFLPFTIVVILFLTDILDCRNYTVPYVLFFYVQMLTGLTNAMIYSVRDQRFRQAVKDILPCSKSSHTKGSVITQSQTVSSTRH